MTDIVRLDDFAKSQSKARKEAMHASIVEMSTAMQLARHAEYSVFWLKETFEYLHILQERLGPDASDYVQGYDPFYHSAEQWLEDFPQYYRFIVGIVKCLEPHFQGQQYTRLCQIVRQNKFVLTELNDIQRAEALYLTGQADQALTDRLMAYARNAGFFAVPNKTACYYLTHIVFYDTQYGTHVPHHSQTYVQALMFAGCFAALDQNTDLLSEICLALRFIKQPVPQVWRDMVIEQNFTFAPPDPTTAIVDDCHTYLMVSWARAVLSDAPLDFKLSRVKPCVTALRGQPSHIHALWSVSKEGGEDPHSLSIALRARGYVAAADAVEDLAQDVEATSEFLHHFKRRGSAAI